MRPKVSSASCIARCTSASTLMSAATNSAAPPCERMRCATASPVGSMSTSTTRAPSAANNSAVASPMPAAAPVTTATLSCSRAPIGYSSLRRRLRSRSSRPNTSARLMSWARAASRSAAKRW